MNDNQSTKIIFDHHRYKNLIVNNPKAQHQQDFKKSSNDIFCHSSNDNRPDLESKNENIFCMKKHDIFQYNQQQRKKYNFFEQDLKMGGTYYNKNLSNDNSCMILNKPSQDFENNQSFTDYIHNNDNIQRENFDFRSGLYENGNHDNSNVFEKIPIKSNLNQRYYNQSSLSGDYSNYNYLTNRTYHSKSYSNINNSIITNDNIFQRENPEKLNRINDCMISNKLSFDDNIQDNYRFAKNMYFEIDQDKNNSRNPRYFYNFRPSSMIFRNSNKHKSFDLIQKYRPYFQTNEGYKSPENNRRNLRDDYDHPFYNYDIIDDKKKKNFQKMKSSIQRDNEELRKRSKSMNNGHISSNYMNRIRRDYSMNEGQNLSNGIKCELDKINNFESFDMEVNHDSNNLNNLGYIKNMNSLYQITENNSNYKNNFLNTNFNDEYIVSYDRNHDHENNNLQQNISYLNCFSNSFDGKDFQVNPERKINHYVNSNTPKINRNNKSFYIEKYFDNKSDTIKIRNPDRYYSDNKILKKNKYYLDIEDKMKESLRGKSFIINRKNMMKLGSRDDNLFKRYRDFDYRDVRQRLFSDPPIRNLTETKNMHRNLIKKYYTPNPKNNTNDYFTSFKKPVKTRFTDIF